MDEPVLVASHEEGVHAAHVVDRHRYISLTDLVQLRGALRCPELYSGVPTGGDDHRVAVNIDRGHVFYGRVVLTNGHYLVRCEVPLFN